jgi:hypothetical protein
MKTTDFKTTLSSSKIRENVNKMFGMNVAFEQYSREQLEDMRNRLRTRVFQQEGRAGINDLLTNETYQKDKAMLDLLNTRIKEMLGENIKQLRDKMMELSEAKKGVRAPKFTKKAAGSKPDFLDMDKDGDKKEPMKKAVADKKAPPKKGVNPFAKKGEKVKEGAKPDFLDMDKDGDKKEPMKKAVADKKVKEGSKIDIKDRKHIKAATKDALTMKVTKADEKKASKDLVKMANKIAPMKKSKTESTANFKRNVKLVNESLGYLLNEDEEGKAKAITAAGDMVNDFTSWMQRVGQYQTKSMIELADSIRADFGAQEAETFKQAVGPALTAALEMLTAQRETISNAVATLAGEAVPEEQMGMEPDMGMGELPPEPGMEPAMPDEMNMATDEFGASDAAAGMGTTGREMRESKFARKLAESHSIMAKLSK